MYRLFMPLVIAVLIFLGNYDEPHYTIMIYMNGSDLESEWGAATDDLAEMLDSGIRVRNANVLIMTGGTEHWMNTAIPETEVVIWQLKDGKINELESLGKVNMGNPNTLRDFIKFSTANFPAEKYGLIMWDHGGGSIAGFGYDEKFAGSSLTLLDMQQAFEESGLRETPLEFLGFDACLMATVEMAVIASDYARVLIAAEDLEPADGWDYRFLSALNKNPQICGFALGEIIVDTFIDFYGKNSDEILTLSVIDLSQISPVMDTMGNLAAKLNTDTNFQALAIRRANTKTFGEGSPRDNYADMVDIGDMAMQLMDLYPNEALAIVDALLNCVTYNRHNADVELFGLSTFYIYGGKSEGESSLGIYSNLNMDDNYTNYLYDFFNALNYHAFTHAYTHTELVLWKPVSQNIYRMEGLLQTDHIDDFLWPRLNNHPVILFPIATTATIRQYAIPMCINGNDADIIVIFSNEYPYGKIKGIRHNSANVFQRGYDPISPTDEMAIFYPQHNFLTGETVWYKGETFTLDKEAKLEWHPAPSTHELGLRHTDICCEYQYS